MPTLRDILLTNAEEFRSKPADPAREWFAFHRYATENGQEQLGCISEWRGRSEQRPFRELRGPRRVFPDRYQEMAAEMYERPIVVRDAVSLQAWHLLGGVALVERRLAERHFPEWTTPKEVGRIAGQGGFVSTDSIPPSALKHAPSKAMRLRVLLRDQCRCRVDGRSPDEDQYTTLHVHHGIPFGNGHSGLTVDDNLFTLCNTCHEGVVTPQMASELLRVLGLDPPKPPKNARQSYAEGVAAYRRLVRAALFEVEKLRATERPVRAARRPQTNANPTGSPLRKSRQPCDASALRSNRARRDRRSSGTSR